MYKLTEDWPMKITDGSFVNPNTNQEYLDWLAEGNTPAPMDSQLQIPFYKDAVQNRLDSTARAYGYDDIKSAVTYADEPSVPKFQNEGKSFRAWRSLCWKYCYEQLDKVQNKERTVPTVEDLVTELPEFVLLQG